VFTSLIKEAMPIIRYRTRDLTRLLPGTARTMRRMDKITGRSDDMMIIRGVNVFPSQIEEQILKISGLSPHYQIEITRDNNLDCITVNVEVRSNDTVEADRQEMSNQLQHQIKSLIGVSSQVKVLDENSVARSQGKAQRVIDNRDLN